MISTEPRTRAAGMKTNLHAFSTMAADERERLPQRLDRFRLDVCRLKGWMVLDILYLSETI